MFYANTKLKQFYKTTETAFEFTNWLSKQKYQWFSFQKQYYNEMHLYRPIIYSLNLSYQTRNNKNILPAFLALTGSEGRRF